jgi:hypothetical protein
MSQSSYAARLVEAIDHLLPAARGARWRYNPPLDEEGYAALRQLHAEVVGRAAAAGLPAPPALEDAGHAVHRRAELFDGQGGASVGYALSRPGRPPEAFDTWEEHLTDLRASAAAMAEPPPPATPDPPKADDGEAQRIAALLEDGDYEKIPAVARGPGTVDERMAKIYAVHKDCLGWKSTRWAFVLGKVTDAAVRKSHWWKVDRRRLKKAERD